MKKQLTFIGSAAVAVLAVGAVVVPAGKVKVTAPSRLITPAMAGDSTDQNGKKFGLEKLLDTRLNSDFTTIQGTTVKPDSAGKLLLQGDGKGSDLQLVGTRLRSDRFAKGNLKITSPERFVVYVDNQEMGRKATSEDSVSAASTKDIELTLEPEHDYDIVIKTVQTGSNPELTIAFEPSAEFESAQIRIDSEMKRRMRVDNVLEGKRVLNTSISPDGKYTLINYVNAYSPKNNQYSSSIVETATGNVVVAGLSTSCNWLPKSNTVYYPVPGADGQDIHTLSIPSMKSEVLLRNVETAQVSFSPDESWVIYYKEDKAPDEAGPLRRQRTPDDRIPGDRDRQNMMLMEVKSGLVRPLTYGNLQNQLLDISNDSKKILYMSTRQDAANWPFYFQSVIEMDVNTLRTDTIIKEDGAIQNAVWSPNGKQLFVLGGPDMLGGETRNIGNHPIANNFDMQGAIYDIATKKVTPVTKDFDPSLGAKAVWNHADGKIYFLGEEGFYKNLYSYDPKTAKISKIPAQLDVLFSYSMGRNESKWITYTGSSLTTSHAAYAVDPKSGRTVTLDTPRDEVFGQIEFGNTEKWTFKASDGTTIDGEMTLPPEFDPTKKYPLIVYYYGGTSPSNHRVDHAYTPNLLASRGYVVYVINPSGTTGYGQEFSARHVNAWGKRTADDIIEGVKEFCKAHKFVDSKKIGCMGASYGGFMTQYLQTQTDIFAAAVSHAGISNVTSYWGEGYWGYSYNSVAAAKSYPWSDPKLFTEQGSLFNADKIHTPLLLLHGTEDTNVPIGESIQLFNALKILGRDVEFITVDGENHVITDVDKKRMWQNTIMAWFEKWLKGDSSWWESMYGKN